MRKFYIEADGVRIALNGENSVRFCDPAGLGFTTTSSFSYITDGFYMRTSRRQAQGSVTGTLAFTSDAYSKYQEVINAIVSAEKLVLVYDPNGTEYKAEVSIQFISKTESHGDIWMEIPISFYLHTPWFTVETITATGTASITAGGQLGTSVRVQTWTELTNPRLTLTDSDGVFADVNLTLTKRAGVLLEYSNHHYDSHIIYNEEDAIQYADLSNPLFGHSRKAFTLSMTGAEMTIEVKKWWRTV